MTRYPLPLLSLIEALKKLPGVGNKTAERFAFQMISWNECDLQEMGSAIASIKKKSSTLLYLPCPNR